MTFDGDLLLAGAKAMTMSGTLIYTPEADYRILRAQSRARKGLARTPARPPAVVSAAPVLVGRRLQGNVVIGDDAARERGAPESPAPVGHDIVVDQANPCFFDHPLDHVPGQLLLEACRQSAIVAAVRESFMPRPSCLVTACRVSFSDFVELDAVAHCSARLLARDGGAGTVRAAVSVQQLGTPVGQVELELTALPESGRYQAGDDNL
jgi:2-oxo-3-(phosphooxy)propyl 3-oxoalkanoate synthase